ncbi:MAG TPA: YciI family protein [Actinospica sp.]|nr:YciI family protein [Actinospica sp.]
MRYMILIRPDLSRAPEGGPSEELMTEMGKLIEEMTRAGALLDTAGLGPAEEASVLQLSGGKVTTVDGPYTEAREFIGGYAMLDVATQEEAAEWAKRFLEIHGDAWEIVAEVRSVFGPE